MKQRFFWSCLGVGVASLIAGSVWLAIVWNDDAARVDGTPYAGGFVIAGCVLLGVAWAMLDEVLDGILARRRRAGSGPPR